jgi:hypothetical protein
MVVYCKILLLLWLVNLAPPLAAHGLRGRIDLPLDRGTGLLGPHKTVRGLLAGTAAGPAAGLLLGLPLGASLLCGLLSMVGDLISSLVKRRLGMASGRDAPGLDHIPEGGLPLVYLRYTGMLDTLEALLLLAVFALAGWAVTVGIKRILLREPFAGYPRLLRVSTRLREILSCSIRSPVLNTLLHPLKLLYYRFLITGLLKASCLYERGRANAGDLRVRRLEPRFTDLPPVFEGYRVLFLSDLHLDNVSDPSGLAGRIKDVCAALRPDLVLLGGDYRMQTFGPYEPALSELLRLVPALRAPDGIVAVLGNHDCVEMAHPMTEAGIRVLVNDAASVHRNGEAIWIAGVDDPRFFRCHDPELAFSGVPDGSFCIFLAHSPCLYREAAAFGPRLYLAGHTHAGQIQLPGLGMVVTHSSAPRRFCSGPWSYGRMLGYTTAGAGVSQVPVRFGCRGEAVLIKLRRGDTTGFPEPEENGPGG